MSVDGKDRRPFVCCLLLVLLTECVTCTKGAMTHTVSRYSVKIRPPEGCDPIAVVADVLPVSIAADVDDVVIVGGASAIIVWLKA